MAKPFVCLQGTQLSMLWPDTRNLMAVTLKDELLAIISDHSMQASCYDEEIADALLTTFDIKAKEHE